METITAYMVHSPYDGGKWRGMEKCQGLEMKHTGVAYALYPTLEDAQAECPVGWRVVTVQVLVPRVGDLLAEAT